jgi:hypothetical protein
VTLKTRLVALEQAQAEAELDRYARFLAEHYRVSVADARDELKGIVARRKAEGDPPLSPEELKEVEALRREMAEWEERTGRARP